MSLPIVLPSLVAVFGIIAIYGQNGWLARVLAAAGVDAKPDIYGLGGVVLAHVFFNLPLAVRLLLPGWHSIPVESWRLAAQLGIELGLRIELVRRHFQQGGELLDIAVLDHIILTSESYYSLADEGLL